MSDTTDAASSDQITPPPQTEETDNGNNREALLELLIEWISTDTWNKSEEILQAHKEQLLSDEALEGLEELHSSLLSDADEDEDERITKTIQLHRAILEKARAESIEAAYTELLNSLPQALPDELNEAIQAMIEANSRTELLEQIAQHPILLTSQATAAIDTLLDELRQANQDDVVRGLEERYVILKQAIEQIEAASRPVPDDLAKLLTDWINAKTWNESQEMLKANVERLLSDEALAALNGSLMRSADKDEGVTKTLLQHRAILEKARAESIEAAYAELLNPELQTQAWQSLSDELRTALQAMIDANRRTELLEKIVEHPILLTPQATAAIDSLLNELRQANQDDIVQDIEERYATLREVVAEQDPKLKALNALARANTPAKLQQVIAQYPILLTDELLDTLAEIITRAEEEGNPTAAQGLRLRLNELRRIRQLQELATHSSSLDHQGRHDDGYEDYGGREIYSATQGGITAREIGTINQDYIENYTPPTKQWQRPRRQAPGKTFVGRQEELDILLKHLAAGETVAITGKTIASTIQGMGGIGKTFLALKLASELNDRFPGGVIRIDLGPQVTDEVSAQVPLSKLARFAFGGIPPVGQLDPEQVAAWLEEMAPGRLLVVFDDVWHQAPLRFLNLALPADAVRLVTTRYANVAQTLGGKVVTLGRLSAEDGLALLEDRLGYQDNTTERADLEELVKLLDGHALALDIAAALINKRSTRVDAVKLVLKDLQEGIGHGQLDDLRLPPDDSRDANVEKSLALSYERMTPEQQHRFRALGVFAVETPITVEAAAAVWGIEDLAIVQDALLELVDLALLNELEDPISSTGTIYRQHGLLRAYAYALLEKADELTSISWAHAQYYTDMVVHTEIADYPVLDQHLPNLLAALHWSAANEPVLLSQMLEASVQLLLVRGQSERIEGYLPNAVAAAAENPVRQANLLKSLGDLERRLGNIDQARSHYDAALPLYRAERDRLGEANVYQRLAYMFVAQEAWVQARTFYEQALPLFIAERNPLGQAGTLIGLGRAKFELGDHEQGMQDVQHAAVLFHSVQDKEWAQRAELRLAEMLARIEQLRVDTELVEAFLNVQSSQQMLQLVQQHPQLLIDHWFTIVEALIASQEDERNKELLRERFDSLKQIRQTLEQEASRSSESEQVVVDFARADWSKRRQLLTEHADLLLNENIESAFDGLLEVNTDPGAIRILEEVRTLVRRCRTWNVDSVWHLELHMRLGDSIEIPTEYEPDVMKAATLLSRQQEDQTALEQAIEAMQALLNRLTAHVPPLFEAALLRDLADAMLNLPADHPARKLDEIEAYYHEALSSYQAADRPLAVTRIQRALGDVLNEQGRYVEASEALQTAIDGFRGNDENKSDLAWAISAYAGALDNLGRTEEALAAYSEAIELLPDTPSLLRNRAETLIHLRRLDEAEADLARAVELEGNENSPYLWFRRAQIAIARGNGVLADQVLDEVLKRDPTYDVLLQRAQSAWLRGELNAAQEALRQALAKANAGERAAMRRDMERLLEEHPDLPGGSLLDTF